VINTIPLLAEDRCEWRSPPNRLANRHSIYIRMNRWPKAGALGRLFAELQREQLIRIKLEASSAVRCLPAFIALDDGAIDHRQG
jgi:hypothetical protein